MICLNNHDLFQLGKAIIILIVIVGLHYWIRRKGNGIP